MATSQSFEILHECDRELTTLQIGIFCRKYQPDERKSAANRHVVTKIGSDFSSIEHLTKSSSQSTPTFQLKNPTVAHCSRHTGARDQNRTKSIFDTVMSGSDPRYRYQYCCKSCKRKIDNSSFGLSASPIAVVVFLVSLRSAPSLKSLTRTDCTYCGSVFLPFPCTCAYHSISKSTVDCLPSFDFLLRER